MDTSTPAPAPMPAPTPAPATAPAPAPAPAPMSAVVPSPVETWPGAFGLIKPARQAFMFNMGTIVALWVISTAISFISTFFQASSQTTVLGTTTYVRTATPTSMLLSVVGFIITMLVAAGMIYTYIASVRGKKVAINEALSTGLHFAWKSFLLNILVGFTIAGGVILLVVPGIIFAVRLSLAQYFLVDKNMGVMEAYKASWNATKGQSGKIWGIIGVTFLFALLFIIPILGWIAGFVLIVLYSSASAFAYEYIQLHPVA